VTAGPYNNGGRGDGEGTVRRWKKAIEGGAHRRGGRQRGAAAMQPVASCSDAGSWTRRQGSAMRAQPRSRRRGNEEGEKKKGGTGVAAPVLTGIDGVEQRRGAGPGWRHVARRWGRRMEGSTAIGR
jgi:hypothetical protein